MIINSTDKLMRIFHGATAFNENGEALERVVEIDTETLVCTIGNHGKKVVAAGFVLYPQPDLYKYLPDGLIPYVCPVAHATPEDMNEFVQKQLEHRRKYYTSEAQYVRLGIPLAMATDPTVASFIRTKWRDRADFEETFHWPKEPFVALAKEVQPTPEEEKKEDERRLKEGKTGLVQEEEFLITAKVATPWNEYFTFNSYKVSSLWMYVKEGELLQWGIAVPPNSNMAIVGNLITATETNGLEDPKIAQFFLEEDPKAFTQLFTKNWRVVATRGKPNQTIEMMCQDDEAAKL